MFLQCRRGGGGGAIANLFDAFVGPGAFWRARWGIWKTNEPGCWYDNGIERNLPAVAGAIPVVVMNKPVAHVYIRYATYTGCPCKKEIQVFGYISQ